MPLILAVRRQVNLRELKASLIYKVSFRTASTVTQRNYLKKQAITTTKKQNKKEGKKEKRNGMAGRKFKDTKEKKNTG